MKTYTTVLGDTFDKIAFEEMGSEYLFPLLLKANPNHRNTLVFSAGVELNIPVIEIDEYPNLPEWMAESPSEEEADEDIVVLDGIDT
jgi:hypothetical protein